MFCKASRNKSHAGTATVEHSRLFTHNPLVFIAVQGTVDENVNMGRTWEGKETAEIPISISSVYIKATCMLFIRSMVKKNKNKKKWTCSIESQGCTLTVYCYTVSVTTAKGFPRFNTTSRCSLKDGPLRWGPQSLVGLFFGIAGFKPKYIP